MSFRSTGLHKGGSCIETQKFPNEIDIQALEDLMRDTNNNDNLLGKESTRERIA